MLCLWVGKSDQADLSPKIQYRQKILPSTAMASDTEH